MKILKVIFIVITCLVVIVCCIFAYYGGFSKVEVSVAEEGGEILVYEVMEGDFSQSGKVMDKVYNELLNDYKIETYKGVGIYYQDPQKVEDKSLLRSDIGCIIEDADTVKLGEIGTKLLVKRIPRQKYIVTEFPMKGIPSVFVSLMKVYPSCNRRVFH